MWIVRSERDVWTRERRRRHGRFVARRRRRRGLSRERGFNETSPEVKGRRLQENKRREEKKRSGEDREDARRGAGNSPRERWPSSFRIRYAQMRTGRLDHWIMIG